MVVFLIFCIFGVSTIAQVSGGGGNCNAQLLQRLKQLKSQQVQEKFCQSGEVAVCKETLEGINQLVDELEAEIKEACKVTGALGNAAAAACGTRGAAPCQSNHGQMTSAARERVQSILGRIQRGLDQISQWQRQNAEAAMRTLQDDQKRRRSESDVTSGAQAAQAGRIQWQEAARVLGKNEEAFQQLQAAAWGTKARNVLSDAQNQFRQTASALGDQRDQANRNQRELGQQQGQGGGMPQMPQMPQGGQGGGQSDASGGAGSGPFSGSELSGDADRRSGTDPLNRPKSNDVRSGPERGLASANPPRNLEEGSVQQFPSSGYGGSELGNSSGRSSDRRGASTRGFGASGGGASDPVPSSFKAGGLGGAAPGLEGMGSEVASAVKGFQQEFGAGGFAGGGGGGAGGALQGLPEEGNLHAGALDSEAGLLPQEDAFGEGEMDHLGDAAELGSEDTSLFLRIHDAHKKCLQKGCLAMDGKR